MSTLSLFDQRTKGVSERCLVRVASSYLVSVEAKLKEGADTLTGGATQVNALEVVIHRKGTGGNGGDDGAGLRGRRLARQLLHIIECKGDGCLRLLHGLNATWQFEIRELCD